MPWYVALLRFETEIDGAAEDGALGEVSYRLVDAVDESAAKAVALAIGVEEQVAYPNEEGEEVFWRFVGVDELAEVDGELKSGVELYSRMYRKESAVP